MTQTEKSTPGVADRGHHEAITTTTSGSESTSMDTLRNLDELVAGMRELSATVAVVVDRLDRIENKLDDLTGVSEQ